MQPGSILRYCCRQPLAAVASNFLLRWLPADLAAAVVGTVTVCAARFFGGLLPLNLEGAARPVSPYGFTVFFARNRLSSSTAIVMWRVARQTAISLASIFRRNVLALILSIAAASLSFTASFSCLCIGDHLLFSSVTIADLGRSHRWPQSFI